ncbi:hypothetical protein ABZ820_41850 [Streptomyces diacarni]|uniref:hypothetical protein n=1 Tax=Streptomyces diacarni TaxID=2800381 RepID=UPI00340D6C63
MTTQDSFERGVVGGLLVFAAGVGLLATVGVLLVLAEQAARTAHALAAAGPAGLGVTVALRRKGGSK